jgi:2-oxoglutarate ferredoxin oxidoreductase subunit alpha
MFGPWQDWGRYQTSTAMPCPTHSSTHPTRAFFTRGTSHDENARYTEDGRIHARVLDRIRRKFDTAATLVPKPEITIRDKGGKTGLIYFGANTPAVHEALDALERDGIKVNALRIKAFPFTREIVSFCAMHERVFVVEQNRDAQMRSLLMTGGRMIPAELRRRMTAAFVRNTV